MSIEYSTGGGVDGWIQAIGGELNSVLGWKVDLKPKPFKESLQDEADPAASGLFRDGWIADYPTAWDLLAPLLGTQPADNPGATTPATATRTSIDCSPPGSPSLMRPSGPRTTAAPSRSPSARTSP